MSLTHRLLTATALLVAVSPALAGDVDLPRYPSISPDGERIVFSWRGDLWLVGAEGGRAEQLTSDPADDLRSTWSPDGKTIAFESSRSGFLNLHAMDHDGSDLRQVTFEDAGVSLGGFTDGGRSLTFASRRENDVYSDPRPYRIAVDGGPIERVHGAHGRFPRVGPNGQRVLFTRGGSSWSRRHYRGPAAREVWLYESIRREFQQLTHWTGNDGRARWAGADRIFYMSDRESDVVGVWSMAPSGDRAGARPVVVLDRDVQSFDVSADGSVVVAHVWDRLYVGRDGAAPEALTITAPRDEGASTFLKDMASEVTEARLSPDGKVMATVAYGQIFVRTLDDDALTRRVTTDVARAKHIAWSPDGVKLYFVSDVSGTDSIFAATVTQTETEVREAFETATNPPEPEVDDSSDESDDATAPDEPEETPAKEDEAEADGADETDSGAAPEDGDAEQDEDDEEESEEAEEEEDAPAADRWHDPITFTIEPILDVGPNDREPRPSPDGRFIAFRRSRGLLCVIELADDDQVTAWQITHGWDTGLDFRWSPDGKWLAYHTEDRNFNSDIWIIDPAVGHSPINISKHPDDDLNPRWSADGRILAFTSERRDEQYDIQVVFLDRELEAMTTQERGDYFEERNKAAKKRKPLGAKKPKKSKAAKESKDGGEKEPAEDDPVELELDDAYLRVRRVTTAPGNEWSLELLPAGDRIVYSTGSELHVVGWDGKDDKKLRGRASIQHLSLDGETVVHVADKKAGTVKSGGGGDKTYALSAKIELPWRAFHEQRFREAMRHLGEVFYHPTMKGLDWNALTQSYLDLARRARTADEFDDIANRMLGELNASHLGIRSPRPPVPNRVANGRLGIDVVADERAPGEWRVTNVLRGGPAEQGSMWLLTGDVITSIDGRPCPADREFVSLLRGKAGRDVLLGVRRPQETDAPMELTVLLRATSSGAVRQLRYETWVRTNTERVHEWSGGRIGYLHIRAMSGGSLRTFERDLYAAADGRDGLLVDVRNNGGGSTADRVLASIMVRPHSYTVPRGADPSMTTGYPQDRLFIQRFVQPMNMLCNEKSFSNAEIVSHAFKTLERGTLVGETTYGGVISTGRMTLLDGTSVRTPFRGWYLPDGTDMENNGATPDLRVAQTPEAEVSGNDEQLRAAVDDLLERLPPR